MVLFVFFFSTYSIPILCPRVCVKDTSLWLKAELPFAICHWVQFLEPVIQWWVIYPFCLDYCPDLLHFWPTEQDHPGPSDIQWGSFPSVSGGALREHHQWRCINGWLFMHTRWPSWTDRGWMQRRSTGPSRLVERVHEQCEFFSYCFIFTTELQLRSLVCAHLFHIHQWKLLC